MKQNIVGFVGLLLITCYLKNSHGVPIIDNNPKAEEEKVAGGNASQQSVSNVNTNSAGFSDSLDNAEKWDSGNFLDHKMTDIFRLRRSPSGSLKQQPQRSADMQTLMGNWHDMDPASLYQLLTSMASSKETHQQDDYYGYDDEEEDPPIDLVYSGKKPLMETSSARIPIPMNVATPSEPIPLMSSNIQNIYRMTDDLEDDVQPLHLHRLSKKSGRFGIFLKKSHFRNGQLEYPSHSAPYGNFRRDLVQLPNGEIAFTPHGLHVLRYHQPVSANLEDNVPVIRRPIL